MTCLAQRVPVPAALQIAQLEEVHQSPQHPGCYGLPSAGKQRQAGSLSRQQRQALHQQAMIFMGPVVKGKSPLLQSMLETRPQRVLASLVPALLLLVGSPHRIQCRVPRAMQVRAASTYHDICLPVHCCMCELQIHNNWEQNSHYMVVHQSLSVHSVLQAMP